MALKIEEVTDKQSAEQSGLSAWRRERTWRVYGAAEPEEALTVNGLPAYGDVYPDTTNSLPYPLYVTSRRSELDGTEGRYLVTITYEYSVSSSSSSKLDDPKPGDEYWDLDMTAQTVHVETCISQTKYGSKSRVVGKLVGSSDDGSVSGVDIYAPSGVLTITRWLSAGSINMSYLRDIIKPVAKVNSSNWYGFLPGEVLYIGPKIPGKDDELVEIEFSFLLSPNEDSSDLPTFEDWAGGTFTISGGKKGWQYLWQEQAELESAGKKTVLPKGVYVSDVYKTSNFSSLGLNGSL